MIKDLHVTNLKTCSETVGFPKTEKAKSRNLYIPRYVSGSDYALIKDGLERSNILLFIQKLVNVCKIHRYYLP
jgi:hypothetical protein